MARFLKDKQKSKGAAPGSLIFIGKQKIETPSITIIKYNQDIFESETVNSINKIEDYLSDQYITWISIHGLHDITLIEQLGQKFNLNSLFMEDILNTDERPKFMDDENHLYVIMKSMYIDDEVNKFHVDQVSIIVGKNYLISFQESPKDNFNDILKRIKDGRTRIRALSTDYLCYAMMDTLVDHYIYNIETLGSYIEEQEQEITENGKEIIEKIYHFKTELAYIRKNVRPVKELISRFLVSDSELINERTYNYLKDLEGLTTQALEVIEIYHSMISDQQNSYNANISNSVNDVMKVLTIFSAIFIPLTFIAGIYGMNFQHMPFLEGRFSYYILCIIMICLALFMIIYFKKKKWL